MNGFRYAVALAFLALAAPAAAQADMRKDVACGATITSDTKLRADLTNCPGDGLVVGADGITLDLGRHTIDGTGALGSQGIRLAGRRGVTIKNGGVQEFVTGIGLDASDANRLSGLTVKGNSGRGVDALNGSDDNRFDDLSASGNRTGLAITDSTGNGVYGSALTSNAFTGVLLFGAQRNRVEGNRLADNVGQGAAIVEGSSDNRIVANAASGSEAGLIVDTSDRNQLALNAVTGNADGIIIVAGDGNQLTGNVVDRSAGGCEGCFGYGIGVLAGERNVVKGNLASRSAADGINVAVPGTTIALNFAFRNGELGINAVPGVKDGGGNRASANGNPAQCVGIRCGR